MADLEEKRNRLRAFWVPRWYNGWVHLAFTSLWSLATTIYAASLVCNPSLWELAMIPIGFVFANFVEYVSHRYPMHHRMRGLTLFFDRHTCIHHAFYTQEAMATDSSRDFKMILFPAHAAVLFVASVDLPAALAIGWLTTANAGWLFCATGTAYYLMYELFHFSYHQPDGHWVRRIPGLAGLSQHHRRHHDPRQMTRRHFNVTFPIFDWLCRT